MAANELDLTDVLGLLDQAMALSGEDNDAAAAADGGFSTLTAIRDMVQNIDTAVKEEPQTTDSFTQIKTMVDKICAKQATEADLCALIDTLSLDELSAFSIMGQSLADICVTNGFCDALQALVRKGVPCDYESSIFGISYLVQAMTPNNFSDWEGKVKMSRYIAHHCSEAYLSQMKPAILSRTTISEDFNSRFQFSEYDAALIAVYNVYKERGIAFELNDEDLDKYPFFKNPQQAGGQWNLSMLSMHKVAITPEAAAQVEELGLNAIDCLDKFRQ